MHDTLILTRVVRLIEAHLADQPDARILAVRLVTNGQSHLAGHDPATLGHAFEVAAAGSRLAGAALQVEVAERSRACAECGNLAELGGSPADCARCGAPLPPLIEEPEVWIKEIVIEETESP